MAADTHQPSHPTHSSRLQAIRRLSNHALATKVDQLNTQKHALDAELLLYLSEIDRRRLYREHACSSLFTFCVTRLACSEDVAYKRVGAARLLGQFPIIFDLLANGRIHLTGLILLKPHLTEDNHLDWLQAACGKTKRQIEKLIATRVPQEDVPTSVRKLPGAIETPPKPSEAQCPSEAQLATKPQRFAGDDLLGVAQPQSPSSAATTSASALGSISIDLEDTTPSSSLQSDSAQSRTFGAAQLDAPQLDAPQSNTAQSKGSGPVDSGVGQSGTAQTLATQSKGQRAAEVRITPWSSQSYRVVFTACESLKQKMDRASALLSHVIAPSDLPALLERALDQLIEREERRRYALLKDPKALNRRAASEGAAIPTAVNSEPVDSESTSPRRAAPESGASEIECRHPKVPELESPQRESHPFVTSELESPQRESHPFVTSELKVPECMVHAPCQRHPTRSSKSQDPDPISRGRVKPRSRCLPAAVRREVFVRDGGQCTFVDKAGRRCEQRHFLEFEHL